MRLQSPHGHAALPPTASSVQKVPNAVIMAPTANLMAFSGTRRSGARAASPAATTTKSAAKAPIALLVQACACRPSAATTSQTSSPSSSTPLNAMSQLAIQSPRATSARVAANSSPSSCSALRPAPRATALPSQRTPKSSRKTPTISCSHRTSNPKPSTPPVATVMAASATRAVSAAPAAARQPMVRLTASTMVNASTHSTAAVRNAGTKMVQSNIAGSVGNRKPSAPLRGGDELGEIESAMPDRFVRQHGSAQSDAANVDAAVNEGRYDIARAGMIAAGIAGAVDQANLGAAPHGPRQRIFQRRRESEHSGAAPALT